MPASSAVAAVGVVVEGVGVEAGVEVALLVGE